MLDVTLVIVLDDPDAPAHVFTPEPLSEHVHVNVTPAVVPVFDFEQLIEGFVLSVHVAVYVAIAVVMDINVLLGDIVAGDIDDCLRLFGFHN